MRICLYTSTALPLVGGQEMVVDALARQFLKLGNSVAVLAPRPTRHPQLGDEQLPYPVIRHPRFISKRYLVGTYCWWLLRAHARFQFDVVHCHGLYQPGYVAALCKRRIRTPVIITSHGEDSPASSHRLKHPKVRHRHVEALRCASSLIAISQFTRAGYEELCPAATSKIVDIPNGVHLEQLTTPVSRPNDLADGIQSGQYALFLGRLSQRKGVDVLLRAMALIDSERVQLVIAGDGDQRQHLQTLAEQLGVARRVVFVGRVEGERKIYLIQNAKFMVTPTRSWEGLPLTVLEGFAAGRFQVATRVPGIVDLVRDGETGLLVRPECHEELAAALRQAFCDEARASRMGQQARELAKEHCWEKIAAAHIQLYTRLLQPSAVFEGQAL